MEDFGKQKEFGNETEIMRAIGKAQTIKEMNVLRVATVKFLKGQHGKEILTKWQKKYWNLKNCSACGHSL